MCVSPVSMHSAWIFGLALQGYWAVSVSEVLGFADAANLSKNRHGAVPMTDVPRKGNII